VYAFPAKRAEAYVKKGIAVYVDAKDIAVAEKKAATVKPKKSARAPGRRDWKAEAFDGDVFQWQVKLKLPLLSKPRIRKKFSDGGGESGRREPEEVGGDSGPTPMQERTLDFLQANEAPVCSIMLKGLADEASRLRASGGWEEFDDPPGIDAVMPRGMTSEQAAERVQVTRIYITPQFLDDMSYIEIHGECAWDPDHGFIAVLHGRRLVGVYQQGTGWVDPIAGKKNSRGR
jgi:hypothetical protein